MPLTASINRDFVVADIENYSVAASARIYKGSAVGVVSGTGLVRALVAGDVFVGFAIDEADNSAGSAGAILAKVRRKGTVQLTVGSLAITDNAGTAVYASDDGTFTKTASGNSLIGYTRKFISAGLGLVEYDAANIKAALQA